MSSTILVVEADLATAQFLCDQLTADGYLPSAVASVEAARQAAEDLHADVVLVGTPSEPRGALELMAEIRAGRKPFDAELPLIALTAQTSELDVVRAFAHGADDVMAKPFGYPELCARIAALLRRTSGRRAGELIRVGELEIDTRARMVRVDGRLVALTQREYSLLVRLASEPERVFTKTERRSRSSPRAGGPAGRSPRGRSRDSRQGWS